MERLASVTTRVPPQNIEAEQSTLGSMMIERAAIEKAGEILKAEDFYRPAHQIIFDALCALAERDEPVDLITVQEELRSRGKLDEVGGTEYLMALLDSVPTASNVEYYSKIVEEKSILRKLIAAGTEVIGMAHEQDVDDIAILSDRAEQAIFQVTQRRIGSYFTSLWELCNASWEQIEQRYKNQGVTSGVPTGFRDLDYMTSGLQPSDFVIIAGRPSMGKTALVLNMAVSSALRSEMAVAIFSIEMSKEQLSLRMICSEAMVDAHKLRTGYLTDSDWDSLSRATGKLALAPIFIDDTSDITPMAMRAKCRRLKAERPLGMIVIDYLQLMKWHRNVDNRNQEISEIARSLKSLARELHVPVIALSQLSRSPEKRDDKRPMLSDLRESGSIEAEADLVALLYRPAYYERKAQIDSDAMSKGHTPGAGDIEEAEVIIAKHRNGPVGTVKLGFQPHYARFVDLEMNRTED